MLGQQAVSGVANKFSNKLIMDFCLCFYTFLCCFYYILYMWMFVRVCLDLWFIERWHIARSCLGTGIAHRGALLMLFFYNITIAFEITCIPTLI